jgi:hypothetical protein
MTSSIEINYWTTQTLTDKLLDSITCKNNRSKYLAKAVAVIYNWTKIEIEEREGEEEGEQHRQNHLITFELGDILNANCSEDGRNVVYELNSLINEGHIEYVLDIIMRKSVKRLFEMISAGWFYESAANQIGVEVIP